jgi:hypothetical protein
MGNAYTDDPEATYRVDPATTSGATILDAGVKVISGLGIPPCVRAVHIGRH